MFILQIFSAKLNSQFCCIIFTTQCQYHQLFTHQMMIRIFCICLQYICFIIKDVYCIKSIRSYQYHKTDIGIISKWQINENFNDTFMILFHPSDPSRLFGYWLSPTSLPQWSTLLFLLIFIMYKHITPNTIYYHSQTFSLMIYNCCIMYTAWCLTLYHNSIYCWALSIYNYFNLLPIPL